MEKEHGNVLCRFEFEGYEQEITIPFTSLTESQIRGATDLFLKFLRNNMVIETEQQK